MEASELMTRGFWQARQGRVLAPPPLEEQGRCIERELNREEGVVFATSGSSGLPKWVFMRRASLLASAEAVNKHLSVSSRDRFLLPLPFYHVGGFGIIARAYVGGCDLRRFPGRWNARRFVEAIEEHGSTLTSLVPAQVHDLVACKLGAPPSLRAVVVGGSALDEVEGQAACNLGWPLLQSYGMTETCSQVATDDLKYANSDFRASPLPVMPQWECRLGPEDRLELRGEALFEFYLRWDGHNLCREEGRDEEGWFRSGDVAELDGRCLTVRGRVDRRVKILGELVDVQALEDELRSGLDGGEVYILLVPDQRRGWRLQPIVERRGRGAGEVDALITLLNEGGPGFARLEQVGFVDELPRTPLGKIDGAALRANFVPR